MLAVINVMGFLYRSLDVQDSQMAGWNVFL